MTYLARLKGRLAKAAREQPDAFAGFAGDPGTHVSPDLGPAVPNFSSGEERKLKNQFFRQKKSPTDVCEVSQIAAEIRLPDEPAKPAKGSLEATDAGPELWRLKFYNLSSRTMPCPGFRDREWPRVFDATHAFLEQHAGAAHALGWTALDLFGVHPVVGAARVDCCGALMLCGARVATVERDTIIFDRPLRYARAANLHAVLLWEFNRR